MIFLTGECDTADTGKVAENEENVQEAVYRINGIAENGVPQAMFYGIQWQSENRN